MDISTYLFFSLIFALLFIFRDVSFVYLIKDSFLLQILMTSLTATTVNDEPFTTVLISAIPKSFRSADLRNFFSQFVEARAFQCFHFRHRPMPPSSENAVSVSQMCFAQIYNKRLKEFLRLYHRKHWINLKGNYLSTLCLISEVTNEGN